MKTLLKKSHTSGSPVLPIYGRSAMVMSVSQRVGICNMKKLIVLLSLATTVSFAQTRHLVGVTLNYSMSSTPNNSFLPTYTDGFGNEIGKGEKQPHDGAGLGVLYRLQLSHFYAQVAPQYLSAGFGYKSPSKIKQQESLTYSFSYLSVPVKVGYFVVDRGFKLGIDAGMSYNMSIGGKSKYTLDYLNTHNEISSTLNANSSVINAIVGLNVGFDISDKVKFELVPQYSVGLTDALSGYKINAFSIGANIGYYLK